MEDNDPEDLYSLQEFTGESKDRPPLEVVDLTAETKVPTDQAEDEPALEKVEPIPVHKPLHTGGEGVFTWQAHGEFIVSSETICPPITHQAHGGYFLQEFINSPTC